MRAYNIQCVFTATPRHVPVILWASGPGPQAIHDRYYYWPDQEFDESEITTIYERYGQRITYIGDWHTHSAPFPELSYRDKRTLRRIAGYKAARVEAPLMLLVSDDEQWDVTIWQGKLRKNYIWGKRFVISNLTVKLFTLED